MRFRLALKLSALLTLFVVASWVVVDWIIRGGDPLYRQGQMLAYMSAAGVGGILFAGILDWLITRPVQRLVDQVRIATEKGWESPIAFRERDEIGELGRALEELRRSVIVHRQELEKWNMELEARVAQRTQQLQETQDQLIQSEKLAGLGQLAAGVAHEVNNPIGVIISRAGYLVSVADEEGLDPDVIDDLHAIEHQAQRVARIVGDLLQFGRPTAAGKAPVVLGEVVELTVSVLRHAAQRAGITLEVKVAGRRPVLGNRDRLEQIAFNLIKNAIDATPSGGKITACADDEEMVVTDTGEGMDETVLSRIFDPFFTTKEVGKGSGLGLAITYGIVTEHGGTITATSRKGEGTEMMVKIPLYEAASADERTEEVR